MVHTFTIVTVNWKKGEGQIYATLLKQLCYLVAPLVWILRTIMRKLYPVNVGNTKHFYSSQYLFNKKFIKNIPDFNLTLNLL